MRFNPFLLSAALSLAGLSAAHAATNNFSVPFFRGSPNSELGFWENFTTASGANTPDRPGSTSDAVLSQSNTNAILTSTFNIYNPSDLSKFTLEDSTPFVLGTVVLQARTLGAELDYSSVVLTYTNQSGLQSLAPEFRLERDRGTALGASLSLLWQWDLTGLGITNYSISFEAAGPSLSFDSMTLDTWDLFTKVVPEIFYNSTLPSLERWMYPFNASPCDRPAGSVFGTIGDASGVDARHAQHLLGWDTASLIPTNRGPTKYLVRSARVTLTINRGNLFVLDPTHDDYRSYLETNNPAFLADTDTGRPVELFGVGFRNDFNINTFDQCAAFGGSGTAQRNAYTVSWNANGALVDVSNNVGKTNELYPSFEAWPFAVGRTTSAAAAEPVPAGAKMTFDLNLNDPFVLAYLQKALHDGKLRLGLSSFHGSDAGQPAFPDFVTHFSETATEPSRFELVAVAVRDIDTDADGLPDDWEEFYFGHLPTATAAQDSDADGLTNAEEMAAGTNPRSSTSALRITSVTQADGALRLRWPHAPNRQYQLETGDEVSSWTPVTGFAPVFLEPGIAEWSIPPEGQKKFYRLRAQ